MSRGRKPYNDDYREDRRVSRRRRRDYYDNDDYSPRGRRDTYYQEEYYDYDDYDGYDDDVKIYDRRGSGARRDDPRGTAGEPARRREPSARRTDRSSRRAAGSARRDSAASAARRERAAETGRRDDGGRRSRRAERYDAGRSRGRGRAAALTIPIAIILLFCVVAAAGVGYLMSLWGKVDSANFKSSDVAVNSGLPASIQRELKDYRTIMIFGVDSRDNTTLQSGTLADSNIVCAIHKQTGAVKLLSIYRDTYVETTQGEHMKLTEVYSKYGAEEQLSTINRNFDMNVTEYVTVNWRAVAETINELGGLELELSSEECKGINKYINEVIKSTGLSSDKIDVEDGTHYVNGVQAVTYCRLRKGLGDDFKRTERQRTVIGKTLAKAKASGIPKVISICNNVFPGISSSLSLTEVISLASSMGKFDIADSSGFPFDYDSTNSGRNYVYPVTLSTNVTELHEYLYGNTDYVPSETVQQLSEAISSETGLY